MRIALTVDPYIPVPPKHYGGIERVVDFLARGLVERGHEITLFAHPESRSAGRLVPYGAPPHFGPVPRAKELWQVGSRLWGLRGEVDVIHSFGRVAALLPVLSLRALPKIQSYQRAIPRSGVRRAHRLAGDSLRFTACSTRMYAGRSLPGSWTTVFNGVDVDRYSFVPDVAPDAPLVFLGRLERIKGVHHAIAIANGSGRELVIAGNAAAAGTEAAYFEREVAPALGRIRYVGAVDDEQKNELLGAACALLMPIEWEEPFGIVMIEAMACGTPVIAFDRGSVPEVVSPGTNGFVCRSVPEAVEAVSRLGAIRRSATRESVERRFSSRVIVDAYERLYRESVLHAGKRAPAES